jgi:hypothetical protein
MLEVRVVLILLVLKISICFAFNTQAQTDSTYRLLEDTNRSPLVVKQAPVSPRKAVIMSLLLPGMGQLYNRSYWKLPLVYATLAYFGWRIVSNDNQYRHFQQAYLYRTDNNPLTVDSYDPSTGTNEVYSDAGLRAQRDFYRRNRDFNILMIIAAYGLTAVEAYVDAHLKYFTVSDKLSWGVKATHFWVAIRI